MRIPTSCSPKPFLRFIIRYVPWRDHGERGFGELTDRTITCRDCGEAFTFTAGEQAFYQERGYSEPQRCANCRAERKAQRAASGYDSGSSSGGYSRGGGVAATPAADIPAVAVVIPGGGGAIIRAAPDVPGRLLACGKETEVPFQPRSGKPVYCRDCFRERRASAPATAAATRPFRFADHTAPGESEADRSGHAPTGRRLSGPPLAERPGPSDPQRANVQRQLAGDRWDQRSKDHTYY